MFGCGQVRMECQLSRGVKLIDAIQYPAYDSFTKSVELEAEQNVKRLRHHPSVVILGTSSKLH